MKMLKRIVLFALIAAMFLTLLCPGAAAKTSAMGQTVNTVLFYVKNSAGEDILVSHIPVSEMEEDMQCGRVDTTNHNYSLLDRYVTTVHQEAQGFTVPDFVSYAKSKSDIAALRNTQLTFDGKDKVAFWEIDQSGFDDMDTYSYNELYGEARYNFPLLYEYWDYRAQDYCDPAGEMSREEVIDHIFANGEPEVFLLSVRAFSQRYMVTSGKYDAGDYNMENLWQSGRLLDNQRTIRVMKPMTENELRNKLPTVSDTRYWVANIRLDMAADPTIKALGKVAAPTATMTEDAENYYISFFCATSGATILSNHNYISPSYAPSCEYTGEAVVIPKELFPDGEVTMNCRAVKDGWTDAGVVTLELTAEGSYTPWASPYADVAEGSWYSGYVQYVSENGLFDAVGAGSFAPNAPMTRAMLATALYRMAGSPETAGISATPFTDVTAAADYADAVAWAYEKGVVDGVSDTTFVPDASITREQITAMLWRYATKVAGVNAEESNELTVFTDSGAISPWAKDTMKWAVGAGLINGMTDTEVAPKGTATRAQVAAMVQRLARYTVWN